MQGRLPSHLSNDNLHRIAISNLKNPLRQIERWWVKKYKSPLKCFSDHTIEELLIEMYEDFYEKNPEQIDLFLQGSVAGREDDDWDGSISKEHDQQMRQRFKPSGKIEKWRTQEQLTKDQEQKIIENLGRNLPGSKMIESHKPIKELGEEFEDDF